MSSITEIFENYKKKKIRKQRKIKQMNSCHLLNLPVLMLFSKKKDKSSNTLLTFTTEKIKFYVEIV